MKDTHQFRVAGVGTAIGAVMFGVLLASCAPGKLPCDKDEAWMAVCNEPGEGGQGGGGGGGGGMGGSAGGLSEATAVANCAAYPTLGKMDEFFLARCGVGEGTCHSGVGAMIWKDLKMPKVWERLSTGTASKAAAACATAQIIDTAAWDKSVIWLITRDPKGTCPDPTKTIARTMPPQDATPKLPLLTADESTCLENYLKAIADGTP
jgi:hypothetical protein